MGIETLGALGSLSTGAASLFKGPQGQRQVISPQVPEPSVPGVGQGQSLQPPVSMLPMPQGSNFQSILQFLGGR